LPADGCDFQAAGDLDEQIFRQPTEPAIPVEIGMHV
jgi:hypothetical protein